MEQVRTAEPKFSQLARHYRQRIQAGELAPGDRLPSYPEFRARGLSQPVVDRALALLEQEGLIAREKGRGVFVRTGSRALTGVIGLYGLEGSSGKHPYGARIMEGVHAGAAAQGADVMLLSGVHPARLQRVDGLVILTPGLENLQEVPAQLSMVSLMWRHKGIPSVVQEDGEATGDLTRQLLALGHRRIAFLYVDWSDAARLDSYRRTLEEHGVEPQEEWTREVTQGADFDRELGFSGHGYLCMKEWLNQGFLRTGCTAIMARNDDVALGVLRALREAGINVPEQMSVTGFDGTVLASHAIPALTTVQAPLFEMGFMGASLLLDRVNGLEVPALTKLPATVQNGDSVGPPPAPS